MVDDRSGRLETLLAGAEVVRAVHSDLFGRQRGKQLPAALLHGTPAPIAYSKMSLAEDLMGVPVSETTFPALAGHPDLHAVVEPETARACPWSPGSVWVLTRLVEHGAPSPLCVRSQLRAAEEALTSSLGLGAVAALEPEFYLFEPRPPGSAPEPYARAGVSYTIDRITDPRGVVDRVHRALARFDVGVTAVNREFSPGQFEINMDHGPATDAADRSFLLKTAIKELAVMEGLSASFMPKPLVGEEGSGLHVHVSLWDGQGRNVLADADGALTPVMRSAIAGVQAHAGAIMAFAAPTVNSAKRLTGEGLSPRSSRWAEDDRHTFLRVPPERGAAARFEMRAGDASASPHLLVAAVLHAARDGVERGLEPSAEGDDLPVTLEGALAALEADEVLSEGFGQELVSVYAAIKRAEIAADAAAVSEWEWRTYVDQA